MSTNMLYSIIITIVLIIILLCVLYLITEDYMEHLKHVKESPHKYVIMNKQKLERDIHYMMRNELYIIPYKDIDFNFYMWNIWNSNGDNIWFNMTKSTCTRTGLIGDEIVIYKFKGFFNFIKCRRLLLKFINDLNNDKYNKDENRKSYKSREFIMNEEDIHND